MTREEMFNLIVFKVQADSGRSVMRVVGSRWTPSTPSWKMRCWVTSLLKAWNFDVLAGLAFS